MSDAVNTQGDAAIEAGGEHVTVQVQLSASYVNQYGGWAAFESSDMFDGWHYTDGNSPAENGYSHGPKWIKFFFAIPGTTSYSQ